LAGRPRPGGLLRPARRGRGLRGGGRHARHPAPGLAPARRRRRLPAVPARRGRGDLPLRPGVPREAGRRARGRPAGGRRVGGGADVVKALSRGARAVLVGRPWVWGLALAGEEGVRTVLRGLLADLDLTLALSGHATVADVSADTLVPA